MLRSIKIFIIILMSVLYLGLQPLQAHLKKNNTDIDTTASHFFLFSYFIGQDKGMCLALSTDGLNWTPVHHAQPVLVPQLGVEKLMRDPSIRKGPDGIYRVVWTTDWKGQQIGYSTSTDLLNWGKQEAIPVMKDMEGTVMCWAPEIFYDDVKKQYIIYWSSAVGKWSIYYVTTPDFKKFSKPEVLFTNGGVGGGNAGNLGPIDAYIYKVNNSKYILFYKKDDNTGIPTLFYRFGKSPLGSWEQEIGPITPSTGDEGPSCIKVGNEYRVYTDPFESDKAYVFVSTDLKKWERKKTNLIMSHGSVIEISRQEALTLLKSNDGKQ